MNRKEKRERERESEKVNPFHPDFIITEEIKEKENTNEEFDYFRKLLRKKKLDICRPFFFSLFFSSRFTLHQYPPGNINCRVRTFFDCRQFKLNRPRIEKLWRFHQQFEVQCVPFGVSVVHDIQLVVIMGSCIS